MTRTWCAVSLLSSLGACFYPPSIKVDADTAEATVPTPPDSAAPPDTETTSPSPLDTGRAPAPWSVPRALTVLDAVATVRGELSGDRFGQSLSHEPGQGLWVGAPLAASGAGAAHLVGRVKGVWQTRFRAEGEPGWEAGWEVAALGDRDGDGWSDLAVAAPALPGRVALVHGPYATTSRLADAVLVAAPEPDSGTFYRLAAGDLNGDGLADLIIGSQDDTSLEHGKVYLVPGGTKRPPPGSALPSGLGLTGGDQGDRFGYAVHAGLDFNGDGLSDLAAGAKQGQDDPVFLSLITAPWPEGASLAEVAATHLLGTEDDRLESMASADLDGDGREDLLLGAPHQGGGGAALLLSSRDWPTEGDRVDLRGAMWSIVQAAEEGQLLGTGAVVGDLDGDGQADTVLVSAGAPDRADRLGVVLGALPAGNHEDSALQSTTFVAPGPNTGLVVAPPADLDGDSRADLALALPREGAGALYFFAGQ